MNDLSEVILMTQPMLASKLTPQKAVLAGHKSFVSKAALLKKCTKIFSELLLSLPSSPDYLRAFKSSIKQDDKHVTSDSFSLSFSRGELRYAELLWFPVSLQLCLGGEAR